MSTINHFPNAAIGSLGDRTIDLVVLLNHSDVLGCEPYKTLVDANSAYTISFNRVDRSIYTPEIMALDKQRCGYLRSLWGQIKSDLGSPEADKAQAAARILLVLQSEGSLSHVISQPMGEKSKIMTKLLDNLNTASLKADLISLNAGVKFTAFSGKNDEFEAVYAQRSNEKAVINAIASATKERRVLEDAFNAFNAYVGAQVTVSSDPIWADLKSKIQERIDELARGYRPKPRTKKDNKNKPQEGEQP